MDQPTPLPLEFSPPLANGKPLRDGLSAIVQTGNSLWLANDESLSLERLTLVREGAPPSLRSASQHRQFRLADYLKLPVTPTEGDGGQEEADIEGLASDGGYLWLVGSHSRKRRQPEPGQDSGKAREQLARITRDGNRFLLARIPLIEHNGICSLATVDATAGSQRTAARLRGSAKGNQLTDALKQDPHLRRFLKLPGKDNGFDIEGLAVQGQRLLLGLRGPVLRGWAVLLELAVEEAPDQPDMLRLARIGGGNARYRKHFLDLRGLGIRDLCIQGDDLLILAGPTMNLDGPVAVFRWQGGARPQAERLVQAADLQLLLEVPYGIGVDHAEGMTLFVPDGGTATSLLIVYDAASPQRKSDPNRVTADIFPLLSDRPA